MWRDGNVEHRVGGVVRSDPEKKIVTSPKLRLFLGEGLSVDFIVV